MKETHSAVAAEALGKGHKEKPKKSGGKHPHRIEMRRGASGGYIARHMHEAGDDGAMPPENGQEHVIPDKAAMLAHMDEHMGDAAPVANGAGGGEDNAGAPAE